MTNSTTTPPSTSEHDRAVGHRSRPYGRRALGARGGPRAAIHPRMLAGQAWTRRPSRISRRPPSHRRGQRRTGSTHRRRVARAVTTTTILGRSLGVGFGRSSARPRGDHGRPDARGDGRSRGGRVATSPPGPSLATAGSPVASAVAPRRSDRPRTAKPGGRARWRPAGRYSARRCRSPRHARDRGRGRRRGPVRTATTLPRSRQRAPPVACCRRPAAGGGLDVEVFDKDALVELGLRRAARRQRRAAPSRRG